jgi:excisionase family DNA binding protein
MEDRLMTIKQLAEYLNVNDRTVLKLVRQGQLPGVKIGNQWRFRKPMIDTWLDDQTLGITPRYVESAEPADAPRQMPALDSCFAASHIQPDLAGRTKTAVVVELAEHAHKLGLVTNATWFVGALIQRESVMPGAVGNGVAILHTLRRHPERVPKPFMVFGRSRQGVDFDALDGGLTHLFLVLGLRHDALHLPWFATFLQMFAQPELQRSLMDAPDASAIYELLIDADRALRPAAVGSLSFPRGVG